MDAGTIQTMIGTLGFPIVCAVGLGWFVFKLWNRQQDENHEREEKLYEFVGEAQKVNEKLTTTNAEFVSVLNTYKADLAEIKADVNDIKERI